MIDNNILIPKCICCNSEDWRLIIDTEGNDYVSCHYCNYYIQIPENTLLQEEKFEEEQKKHYDEDSLMLSPLFTFLQQEATNKRFEVLRKYLPKGRLIEVGPGNGDVLAQAIKIGYKVDAVEHSESLGTEINKRFGISVKVGAFETQQFNDEKYDAYMSFHVIEHVPNVIDHLKKASSIVKEGGFAFIATPNADSWQHNMPFKLSPNYSTAHLQLFSIKALSLCLKQSGWEVVEVITPEYTSAWLRVLTAIVRRFKGPNKSVKRGEYFKSKSTKIKAIVKLFSFLSYPFRMFQEKLKRGNELFIVAKRIS